MRQKVPYRGITFGYQIELRCANIWSSVAGLEGSEDNPILIDLDDATLSEGDTEICTSQENFDGSPENPICILDEAAVCESLESRTEDNAAVPCPHSSLLDHVGTRTESMEDPQSESECLVGMECSPVQMQGAVTTRFDSPEPPVYYFTESRLSERPESDWQGTTPVGSPRISVGSSICIPEGSVDVEPQRDYSIAMDSALPQTESAARAVSGSSELHIRNPEVPALVDGMYSAFLTCSRLLICQSECANSNLCTGREKIRTWYAL
jgi:hypothetical protein